MKRIVITGWCSFFIICFVPCVWAQDPNFSQFFASPLTLNPALTGNFEGTVRVAGNYRNQWPVILNTFRTGTISADFQLMKNKISDNDRMGFGIMGMYDENGNGVMKNNYVTGSYAYHKGLDENGYHQIGAGISGTYAQKTVNASKFIFEDQLSTLGFTENTSEILSGNQQLNLAYFSVNAGLLYTGATNDYNQFYAGVSVYHVNRPEKSFAGNTFQSRERVTVHGGGYFPVAQRTTLFLSGNFQMQRRATEAILGGAIGWLLNEDAEYPAEFYAGGWFRVGDAVIPFAGMDIQNMRIGLSYDVNISGLAQASKRQGGFELSLIYIQRYKDKTRKALRCPNNF